MSREIVWIHSDPIYVNCKKHYCPDCNARLGKITESRIIRPYSPETSKFEYPVTDRSHSELRETKFCCPDCGKIISVPDMKRIEGVPDVPKWFIPVFIIALILLLVFFPYIKAEYLTLRYGGQFEALEHHAELLTEAKYFKVVDYSESEAKVYYVSDERVCLVTFGRDESSEWIRTDWRCDWSEAGSADEFTWPYYR